MKKVLRKKLWRVGARELSYIKRAIDGGLTGEMTKTLEARFANKFGVEYAIAVNSGTSALHCALAALGVGPGDQVIVPPLTFAATAFCVLYLKAVPVFADVDPGTFNIDPRDIEKKITAKTKAIIAVSLYGLPVEIDRIMTIARQHKIKVIEDDAQCVLGWYNGKYKGTIAGSVADASIFSFQRSKHLTTGDGGMVTTNSAAIALKVRKFGDLGYTTLTAKPISNENFKEKIQNPDFLRHDFVGYNFRMPEVCAAMAIAQLEKVDMLVKKRTAIAKLYKEALRQCDWLVPQRTPPGVVHSYWTYVLRLDSSMKDVTWQDFRKVFLKSGGEPFYAAWQLTYLEPALLGREFPEHRMKYERGLCPVAESLQPHLIQLKTNFESLTHAKKQSEALARTIKYFS